MFESHESIAMCMAILWFCVPHQQSHKQGQHKRQNYQGHHKPTLFCSSLVGSKPTWPWPKELKFEAKNYFCCISIDRTTIPSLQMEIFAFFKLKKNNFLRQTCSFTSCPEKLNLSFSFTLSHQQVFSNLFFSFIESKCKIIMSPLK